MQYIDIHGHYAWNVDDGIETRKDAIEALKIAKDEHIEAVVATPHVISGRHTKEDLRNIKQRINELKKEAKTQQIEVYEGCELFLNHDAMEALTHDLFIPIENTKYLLCEFDVRKELSQDETEVEDILYEMTLKGYTPVIAHVERYFKDKIDIDRIQEWVEAGYVIQINSTSFLGLHGKTCQKNAYALIDNGLGHIIASDTHRCRGHRIPNLNQVNQILSKKYDDKTLHTLLYDNPQHIINNEKVRKIEPKKSFIKKIFGRSIC